MVGDTRLTCSVCQSNYYFRRRYDVEQVCKVCKTITRIYANGECMPCLKESGWKECNRCHQILLAHWHFHSKQAVCKECRLTGGSKG